MVEHGGRVRAAARRFGRAPEEWLDLSTGISPYAWRVGAVPIEVWRRLPDEDDGLIDAARDYYGTVHIAATAGSQAAIEALPALRPPAVVGIVSPTYGEHEHAWQRAGHSIRLIDAADGLETDVDVLVACNPNNPTAAVIPRDVLLRWHAQQGRRGAWLVVDEAFADIDAAQSLVRECGTPGLIVLRSLGKFFGLAGMRLGFVAAWPELIDALRERLGPWATAGPARWIGRRALTDDSWQHAQRERLRAASDRLAATLEAAALSPGGRTGLFVWVPTPHAAALAHFFAQRAILIRTFVHPAGARFGLPGAASEWERLDKALDAWKRAHA